VPQHPVSKIARFSRSILETYDLCIIRDLFLVEGNIVGLKQLLWIGGDMGVLAMRMPSLPNVSMETTNCLSADMTMSTDDWSSDAVGSQVDADREEVGGVCRRGLAAVDWRSADLLLSRPLKGVASRLGP